MIRWNNVFTRKVNRKKTFRELLQISQYDQQTLKKTKLDLMFGQISGSVSHRLIFSPPNDSNPRNS